MTQKAKQSYKELTNAKNPESPLSEQDRGVHSHFTAEGEELIHTHSHKHIHSAEEKRAVLNRLSKAAGHLEAVKRMIEDDAECSDVLVQLAAVRSAINNTGKVILKNHISHCLVEAVEEHDEQAIIDLNQAIDKFVK